LIEIIAMTPKDASCIEACGADRIELVSAFSEGGLTPSYGIIERVVKTVKIPVNVMIRPHSKSFSYTQEEIEAMKKDIKIAKELGANGVVFGVLDVSGKICEDTIQKLLESCKGLDVTFHRAIDEVSDLVEGIKILKKYPQIKTILTSGGKGNIIDNIPIIKEMIKAAGHIDVMVGGGLNQENIKNIMEQTEATQYHFGTAVRHNKSFNGEIDPAKLISLIEMMKVSK
jgi:copper homeostasis protein